MANFNLGERELNINVKNLTLDKIENTTFKVKDFKGENFYKGSYFLSDIKEIDNEGLSLHFGTIHCDYKIDLKIDPNNYQKNIDIEYKYDNNFSCLLDISPNSIKQSMEISTKQITPNYNISLNDLQVWHYMSGIIFGLFLVIYIGIEIIDRKGLLIHNKKK